MFDMRPLRRALVSIAMLLSLAVWALVIVKGCST